MQRRKGVVEAVGGSIPQLHSSGTATRRLAVQASFADARCLTRHLL